MGANKANPLQDGGLNRVASLLLNTPVAEFIAPIANVQSSKVRTLESADYRQVRSG